MIVLKPLSAEHVSPFLEWINDKEVIKYSLSLFNKLNTEAEIRNWFSELLADNENLNLGVFVEETDMLIGYAGIVDISKTNRSGEYFIFIGDKKYWGKGIGTEVTKKVLKIGFNDLDLNRIMLTVSEPNIGGVRAYEKAGFKYEGRLREAAFRDNTFHDKIVMSVLKHEWNK